MNIDDFRSQFRATLDGQYEPEEIESLSSLTFDHVLNMNRVEVSLSRKQKLSTSQLSQLEEVLARLEKGEPIQYITGKTEFYGRAFQVNPATLIPRPETEELVEWIFNSEFRIRNSELRVLDIGTGSGCIAITLASRLSGCRVEGVDISKNALATAYQNAKVNQVEVNFYQQDILEVEILDGAYDIIVSNPPYVRKQEKKAMRENVLGNEPRSALFVSDEDPLIFYRKIGGLAYQSLTDKGMLFFEINESLGEEMVALLHQIGFKTVELKKDMFGKDRMVRATNHLGN